MLTGLLRLYPAAAEPSYENELAAALVGRTGPGEVIFLTEAGDRFAGIFHQHLTEPAQGAALILHGLGQHPDWPEVIAPLRLNLPVGGWATLTIQLPVLDLDAPLSGYGATVARAETRIGSAVSYLREKKFRNIVIIGYGFGAVTAAAYLADSGSGIRGFAGISMQNFDVLQPRRDLDDMLARISIPVLDLTGSRDYSDVRRQGGEWISRPGYRQVVIDGADHKFTGLEDVMIRSVREWLDSTVPGTRAMETGGQDK